MAKIYYQKCPFCGGEAFRFKRRPYKGMKIETSVVDATNVKSGNIIRCGECNQILFSKHLIEKNLGVIEEK